MTAIERRHDLVASVGLMNLREGGMTPSPWGLCRQKSRRSRVSDHLFHADQGAVASEAFVGSFHEREHFNRFRGRDRRFAGSEERTDFVDERFVAREAAVEGHPFVAEGGEGVIPVIFQACATRRCDRRPNGL